MSVGICRRKQSAVIRCRWRSDSNCHLLAVCRCFTYAGWRWEVARSRCCLVRGRQLQRNQQQAPSSHKCGRLLAAAQRRSRRHRSWPVAQVMTLIALLAGLRDWCPVLRWSLTGPWWMSTSQWIVERWFSRRNRWQHAYTDCRVDPVTATVEHTTGKWRSTQRWWRKDESFPRTAHHGARDSVRTHRTPRRYADRKWQSRSNLRHTDAGCRLFWWLSSDGCTRDVIGLRTKPETQRGTHNCRHLMHWNRYGVWCLCKHNEVSMSA